MTVTRDDGRYTTIALARVGKDGAVDAPYFQRRFDHGETKEVRLHLADGDDRVVVRGPGGGGVRIRVLADGGAEEPGGYNDSGEGPGG